jgi:hypothetical protein
MKICFQGSISGKKKYQKNYEKIVDTLKSSGHSVIQQTTTLSFEEVYGRSKEERIKQYNKIVRWIEQSDLAVIEVSKPSVGLGHEISLALERNKLVLVLYCEGNSTHFMEGLKSDRFLIVKYSMSTLEDDLLNAIDYLSGNQDQRYNIMLAPDMMTFLDKRAKENRLPKSVIIRKLISDEMKKEG